MRVKADLKIDCNGATSFNSVKNVEIIIFNC